MLIDSDGMLTDVAGSLIDSRMIQRSISRILPVFSATGMNCEGGIGLFWVLFVAHPDQNFKVAKASIVGVEYALEVHLQQVIVQRLLDAFLPAPAIHHFAGNILVRSINAPCVLARGFRLIHGHVRVGNQLFAVAGMLRE